MNDTTQATAPTAAAANSLWAAVGVLGVVVVALGSALYFVQTQKEELRVANNASGAAASVTSTAPQAPEPVVEPTRPEAKKQPAGQTKHANQTARAAASADKPVVSIASPAVVPPAREVCLNCGTVTASTPIEREGTGSGAGAVAGGVLGALLGNQIGQGQGKDVATIVGAVGGGIAGNSVEKKMKKQTVFQVQVRLDDGSTRTLEQAEPVGVGVRVRVEGSTLQPLAANR